MKRLMIILVLPLTVAISCQKMSLSDEAGPEDTRYVRTLKVGIEEDGTATRVGFDEDNSMYWHKGDAIGVQTIAGVKPMILQDDFAGMPSGIFEGSFEEEIGSYVVYPYDEFHIIDDRTLTYFIPDMRSYVSVAEEEKSFNPPMAGRIDGPAATLNHLASFFKIIVQNIPAGGEDMKLVFTADRRIAGSFVVDLSADVPVINTDDQEGGRTVTIEFDNNVEGKDAVFYIPAPLGTYGSIAVEVKDGETSLISRTWINQTVRRRTPKKGTVPVGFVAVIDGVRYKTLAEAFEAVDNQTITLVNDVEVAEPLVLAQGKKAVFDMNRRTVSGTATSASASSLISVKRSADLLIRNGSLIFAATAPDTEWGGEGQAPYPGYANNAIRNEGVLTIENAMIENRTMKGGASYVVDNYNGAKLTVNEGSEILQSGGDIAIRMFNGSDGAIDVTINGGIITGYRAVWIQLASTTATVAPVMNLTVTGGTLNSSDTVYGQAVYSYSYGNDMKNVLINVSGGVFNGDIALTGGANKTNIETVNISGGRFNGPWEGIYSYGDYEKAVGTIRITGGIFPDDPTYFLADGYQAVQTADGWVVSPVN